MRKGILENDERFVFVDKFCRPLLPDDLTEQAITFHNAMKRTPASGYPEDATKRKNVLANYTTAHSLIEAMMR